MTSSSLRYRSASTKIFKRIRSLVKKFHWHASYFFIFVFQCMQIYEHCWIFFSACIWMKNCHRMLWNLVHTVIISATYRTNIWCMTKMVLNLCVKENLIVLSMNYRFLLSAIIIVISTFRRSWQVAMKISIHWESQRWCLIIQCHVLIKEKEINVFQLSTFWSKHSDELPNLRSPPRLWGGEEWKAPKEEKEIS